jgi:hypothetical protein
MRTFLDIKHLRSAWDAAAAAAAAVEPMTANVYLHV